MGTSRRLIRRYAPAAAVVVIAALTQPAWAAVTPAPHSAHFNLVTKASHVQFLGERQIPGGDYTASWRVYGETVRVAGPAGSTVTVPKPAAQQSLVMIRPPSSLHKGSLAALAAAYAQAGKSVVQDAIAVGYSPAQARKLAGATRGGHPRYNPGDIIETPCASVSGDSNNAWGRACDVQKMVQDNGGGNWIIGDETTASGNDTGAWPWNTLESLTAYVNYGPNNSIVQWKPGSSQPEGNCSTVGLTVGQDGVSISDSTTVCPDRLDPYGVYNGKTFGAKWSGCDTENYTEGADSVDIDNNPANASEWPGLTVGISWGWC